MTQPTRKQIGRVYLLGAGPGNPELLTMKAYRLLTEPPGPEPVVVFDRLVSEAVLGLVPPGVSRIYAGKAPGQRCIAQAQVNALLSGLARSGHTVLRLKGGDPFVFARGGEEALHLARHGIAFEVVPGVTAAVACAAYAGIPLTHRDLARSVHFVTGHSRADDTPLDLDWRTLGDPDATLAIYMGLANAERIASELQSAGLSPSTPVAVIERGTLAEQRHLQTTLGALSATLQKQAVESPALIIVGRVASLGKALAWFEPTWDEDSHVAIRRASSVT